MHPFVRFGGGGGQVLGTQTAFFEGGIGADTRYRRISVSGALTVLIPGPAYPYGYDEMEETCRNRRTEEQVPIKFCGSDAKKSGSDPSFTLINFEASYAVFGVYDGVYLGGGLRLGMLGATPYASLRWSPSDRTFWAPVFSVRAGADFVQAGLAVEPFNFPVGIK